ncbi:hypothetical protein [Halobacteriaceae bacterium SHR40]|uniref:hypothetical protein n=1 Tax=Halovenus amylolytica TaxID=2500550 RepID=UPI000FE2AE70
MANSEDKAFETEGACARLTAWVPAGARYLDDAGIRELDRRAERRIYLFPCIYSWKERIREEDTLVTLG